MDRDRFSSYPVASAEDELFLGLLALEGTSERTVTAVASDGTRRGIAVIGSITVEEPNDGKADVVSRVELGEALAEGEQVEEDLWEVAASFLEAAERKARRLLGAALPIADGEKPHGVEYVIDVSWGGTPRRYGIPAGSEREAEASSAPRPADKVKTQPPVRTSRLLREV